MARPQPPQGSGKTRRRARYIFRRPESWQLNIARLSAIVKSCKKWMKPTLISCSAARQVRTSQSNSKITTRALSRNILQRTSTSWMWVTFCIKRRAITVARRLATQACRRQRCIDADLVIMAKCKWSSKKLASSRYSVGTRIRARSSQAQPWAISWVPKNRSERRKRTHRSSWTQTSTHLLLDTSQFIKRRPKTLRELLELSNTEMTAVKRRKKCG